MYSKYKILTAASVLFIACFFALQSCHHADENQKRYQVPGNGQLVEQPFNRYR